MKKWNFPTRGFGETEGFSNAGLAEFKGNPLASLAREICQNSLDASDGSGKPVRVEFHLHYIGVNDFPGMEDMRIVLNRCDDFWAKEGDLKTKTFLNSAKSAIDKSKFFVLRVSDFNTKGVEGAFSNSSITPWDGLVKGNSFSVKSDEKNAQGSYGIGKSAPFVSSSIQTVFYRTYDINDDKACLGVARLMSHKLPLNECVDGEDPVRRSTGYFGEDENRMPSVSMPELDKLYTRNDRGTDLFIPAFNSSSSDDTWKKQILLEVVNNFLYSIYSKKLEVVVDDRILTSETLPAIIEYLGTKAKDASQFYSVIMDNPNVIEIEESYLQGVLKLRLLYGTDLNRKILVVRNSGMKIAKISALPRSISYTGFFELQGDKLNQMFRLMENPKHDAWEPSRHDDPVKAKKTKEYVEDWVRGKITEKILEVVGEESVIDIGDCLSYKKIYDNDKSRRTEIITDSTKNVDQDGYEATTKSTFKIKDEGGSNNRGRNTSSAIADPNGTNVGHRRRTGTKKGISPTGRKVSPNENGPDTMYEGAHEVPVAARIISKGNGLNKLVFKTFDDVALGEMEIVSKGENGKSLRINVEDVEGENVSVESGHIVIKNIVAEQKNELEFRILGNKNYAMEVRAYGNKK